MFLSEQELSIQVADFDHIRVCKNYLSAKLILPLGFTCSNTKHGIVLK